MSQTVNNQYYTDRYRSQNYGTKTAATQASYDSQMEQDSNPVYSDTYPQDSFEGPIPEDGSQGPVSSSDARDAIQSHLDELEATLNSDPTLKELKPQLAQLKSQLLQVSAPFMDEQGRQALLNQIDAKLTELDATVSNAGPVEALDQRIEELNKKIQGTDIPADRASDKDALQKRIDQVRARVDLKVDSGDLQKAQDEVDSIETDLETLQSDIETKREGDLSSLEEKSNTLSQKIDESSYLRDEEKQALKSQLEAKVTELRQGLQDGTTTPDEAQAALDAIDYTAGSQARHGQLARDFDGLSAKVPSKGYAWEVTKQLASEITSAMHSGNWDKAKKLLDKLSNDGDDGYSTAQGNNVVMQVMGTIYYKLAGSDSEKFNAYLDLIDVDVRKKMETAVMACKGEQYNPDGYNSAADKEAGCIYGIPADCKDALEASIQWSQDPQRGRVRLTVNQDATTNS